MPETHANRRSALRATLQALDVDALLIVDLLNIRYLTGFTGSNAALLVHAEDDQNTRFCTDGRYLTQSSHEVPDLERLIDRRSALALADHAGKESAHFRHTGYESHGVTVEELDVLAGAAQRVELVRAPGMVEELRMVKDDAEVEALRMACAAADRALAELIEHGGLVAGRTELEVARELEN